jgi:hypothetical protein
LTTSNHLTGATRGSRDPEDLDPPGLARVRRIALIRREVRESLAPAALDLLFSHADEVVEGGIDPGDGPRRAYATVMVTVDLARCAGLLREPADEATAARLAELMADERRVHERLVALARRELARLTGLPGRRLRVHLEHRARADGCRVLLDADAMVSVGAVPAAR